MRRRANVCDAHALTVRQDLGLAGGTEANVMENEKRERRAAPVLEPAHLCEQV